jgi:hypothetical protein
MVQLLFVVPVDEQIQASPRRKTQINHAIALQDYINTQYIVKISTLISLHFSTGSRIVLKIVLEINVAKLPNPSSLISLASPKIFSSASRFEFRSEVASPKILISLCNKDITKKISLESRL